MDHKKPCFNLKSNKGTNEVYCNGLKKLLCKGCKFYKPYDDKENNEHMAEYTAWQQNRFYPNSNAPRT